MVKFSKQLEAQLIPEWKGAFVNYWELKKDVKQIKLMRNKAAVCTRNEEGSMLSIFGYTSDSIGDYLKARTRAWITRGTDPHAIQIHEREEDIYETELVQLLEEEEAEATKNFFKRLDTQLNTVNQFYRSKEAEFLERVDNLQQQMQILIQLKSNRSFAFNTPPSTPLQGMGMDSNELMEGEEVCEEVNELENKDVKMRSDKEKNKWFSVRGKHMRVDIPATTPSRTISAITQMVWGDFITQSNDAASDSLTPITSKKIQTAEKIIRGAFVDLYRGLCLLKTYSSLNMVAFGKILKKFDKVSDQEVAHVYLKAVERSYFNSSDNVVKLVDEVECVFIKYFTKDDRKKAMRFLRPKQIKDSHTVTFFIGLFTGCFLALFMGYAILAHLNRMYTDPTHSSYIEIVYPVFSMFALLNLHIFVYGCNIFMWRSTRINYSFIFEFSPNKELNYRDVFLMCSTLMTVVVGAMVAHLTLRAKGFSHVETDAIPASLLLVFISMLFCPFNIVYRSTRFLFLKVMRNIILAPLYKVVMTDFFMADQLTSQVTLLRHLEFIACYYIGGSFLSDDYATCRHSKVYNGMAYAISFLPYYWRALQCARRWMEEGDANHLANLGKYVSAIIATGARLTYAMHPNTGWLIAVILTSIIATIYQLYWDFVKDWGLLNPHSKNPWLRDELILKHKSLYFISIALNLVLRLTWLQTIIHLNHESYGYRVIDFVFASLEVFRRGHWNFYRLENEHLNNVGKYRAVKTVPLPFHELVVE